MVRVLWNTFAAFAAIYCSYAGLMFWRQRDLMYPGAAQAHAPLVAWGEGAKPVTMPASFGLARALFLPAFGTSGKAPAVIFMHGNNQHIDQFGSAFDGVRRLGVHVLLLEYPGYAGSPGEPTFGSLREAATLAFDWLLRREGVDIARIIAMGGSLGGGPACQLTADRPVKALVLMSTFADAGQFARERWLPSLLVLDRFDNLSRVREFAGPVLVLHGRRDDVIPFASGEALARSARLATFVALDCGHENCPYLGPPFVGTFERFLLEHGVLVRGVAVRAAISRPDRTPAG
jgi:hypothetical protein